MARWQVMLEDIPTGQVIDDGQTLDPGDESFTRPVAPVGCTLSYLGDSLPAPEGN